MTGARLRRWLPAAAVLLAGITAGVVLSSGILRPPPRTGPVRHEDPAIAAVETDPTALFAWYVTSLSQFRGRRFPEGRRLIIRLRDAHLAPDLQALAREVNLLLIKEGSILEAADARLREGASLLAAGRTSAAEPLLAQIDQYARRGTILADDLLEGAQALGRQSRVADLSAGEPGRQAYDDLLAALPEIKSMLVQYRAAAAGARTAARSAALPLPLPPPLAEWIAYPTTIMLSAASPAYPGRTFRVSGTAAENGPAPSQRTITLRLDDASLAMLPLGAFRRDLLLPPATSPGLHVVSAMVPARGAYLAAEAQAPIRVTRAPPVVRLQVPGRTLAPGRLDVTGRVRSRFGALNGAVVNVRAGPVVATTRTTAHGEFAVGVRFPGALDLVGTQTITVRVVPQEPWNAPVDTGASVFVINLFSVALAGTVALAAPIAGLARLRRSRRQRIAHPVPRPAPKSAAPIAIPTIEAPPQVTPHEEVMAIYRQAAAAVQRRTRVVPAPATTLREYARLTGLLLGGDAFMQLTMLVETALYSAWPVTPGHPPQAREIALRVENEAAHAG